MRATRAALAVALLDALVLGAPVGGVEAASPAPTASTTQPARWTKHQVHLAYQGFTTKYSCEGLKQKVRALLRYFGARSDRIRLRAHGCAGGPYRPSPAIELEMEFETLAPAPAEGASAAVAARWIERDLVGETKISRDAPSFIERGDCELVQKFVVTVLPSFTHEIIHDLTRCIPHELNGTLPNIRVRVLAPETDRNGSRSRPRRAGARRLVDAGDLAAGDGAVSA